MAEGRSNHAIAETLVVTDRAVEKHVTSIFGKLGLPPTQDDHRRVLAVLAYLRPDPDRSGSWSVPSRARSGTLDVCLRPPHSHGNLAIVSATDVTRRYGEGEAAVDALDGVTSTSRRPLHRDHGPVGLRQVDADARPRRAGPADVAAPS